MAHTLKRLERKNIFNKPHLIDAASLESVVEYINERPDGLMDKTELAVMRDLASYHKSEGFSEGDELAVIPITGVLTYEETFFGAICGMSSYQGILTSMEKAAEKGYKTVVLDVDSGGGEAYGVFETAKQLREIADRNGMRLIAYVDGISASAAYGLSVAADEVIINPYAEVGSIGVVTRLENDSDKMKKEGVTRTYVYAGDNKIPFDKEGEWREDFIADLQSKVDTLYSDFVSHVAEMRGISEAAVEETQAKMFSSARSIEIGLADKAMERMEFAEYLADLSEGNNDMPLNFMKKDKDKEETMSNSPETKETPEMETPEVSGTDTAMSDLLAQVAEMQAKLDSVTLAKDQSEAEKAALLAQRENEALESLAEELQMFSFVEDTKGLSQILMGIEEGSRETLMAVLSKADKASKEMSQESLAVEGEDDTPELSEKERNKLATKAEIEKRLAKAKA